MVSRPGRPVSWHPSSSSSSQPQQMPQMPCQARPAPLQLPQHNHQYNHQYQYPGPGLNDADFYSKYMDFPPTPAAYSGYTSPASAFSPLSLPYTTTAATAAAHVEVSRPTAADATSFCPSATSAALGLLPPPPPQQQQQQFHFSQQQPLPTHNFHPFARTPPTPDNVPMVAADPAFKLAPEEAIPYQSLEMAASARDDQANGEILYGMGLYDAPDARESAGQQQQQQPQRFQQWHGATMTALLGGPATAPPEPKGRGLKLEDAWEPPESDAEDDDEDAEGDEDEESEE